MAQLHKFFLITLMVILFWCGSVPGYLFFRYKKIEASSPSPVSTEKAFFAKKSFIEKNRIAYTLPIEEKSEYAFSLQDTMQQLIKKSDIDAKAVMVLDARTGTILFEKDPDMIRVPASLTKLVAIYTAMRAIDAGELSLSDTLTPPKVAWAINMPPRSSLMFLGERQKLTVEELIRGMAVVSGNDAARALGILVSGSEEAFVQRMNTEMKRLGLVHTHFVEATGLSRENKTTAREFALFSAAYIKEYPDNLALFHSVKELTYPQKHNMLRPDNEIHQRATNTLLDKISGVDGLKTGYTKSAGFNISLTTQRDDSRFVTVLLGGQGKTSNEGRKNREKDCIAITQVLFDHYKTIKLDIDALVAQRKCIVSGGLERSLQPLICYTSFSEDSLTVHKDTSKRDLVYSLNLPQYLHAPIFAGELIGTLTVIDKNSRYKVKTIPLLADRDIGAASSLSQKLDSLAISFFGK